MANKERYQNPVINDNIKLRLLAYNSNQKANFESIEKVEIYFLDPTEVSESNPRGLRLVRTINGTDVSNTDVGSYITSFVAEPLLYTIGKYVDIWYVTVDGESATVENNFEI